MRFPVLVLAVFALLAPGCIPLGCDADTSNYDSSAITLTSPRVTAARIPDCGPSTAAFAGGFALSIDAADGSFLVSVEGSAGLGRPIPLEVKASGDGSPAQVGTAADRTIRLTYNPGRAPVDDTGLASAIVTVVSAPTGHSSAPLSLSLDLRFLDGRELAETFTAPVGPASACPVD